MACIALTTRISRTDQRFLQSVATGKAGATTCGRDGLPAAGVYLPARDLFGLLLAFDGIVNRNLREGTPLPDPGPTTPCERVACPSGTRTFRVEPGLRGFHLLADLAERFARPGSILLVGWRTTRNGCAASNSAAPRQAGA